MKSAELLELAKVVGASTAGTHADVADRLIVKFETMRNNNPDVMIVESFFYFAFKGFPDRSDYRDAFNRIKEFVLICFDDVDVFVDDIGVHEGLEMV